MVIKQFWQDSLYMIDVFTFGLWINEDNINVSDNTLIQEVSEDIIDERLEY